ncbi:hypothetical protein RB628_12920 [Streptomyces sp. ADMS]|uniref:hypothetical protein n=1 Tax=Streptomyces sp. ADMS TaxID=3071415 RepID=UPI00296F9AF2|nr:hypothetical protein [Streptomyces sp. ADMS]MDW4906215.1 hypothetical protein [Streptomyces sp. ADMS]
MRTHNTRTATRLTLALALTTALFAAGCGSEKAQDSTVSKPATKKSPAPSGGRARQVADAWDGSEAAEVWRSGYHPLGDTAPPPEGGWHSNDDRTAHLLENYVLRGKLPTTAPEKGQVKWEGGQSLTLPLMDARQTYTALARVDSPTDPQLTITGARLGEMTIVTGRGPATVPTWLFTLEGYDEPLRRVAFEPSKLPKSPIERATGGRTTRAGLSQLGRVVGASEDGRSVTVVAYHGSCDDGPVVDVLETDGSVVLSASVAGGSTGEICDAVLLGEKVTVKLDRPLDGRVLLDAFMGRPLPHKKYKLQQHPCLARDLTHHHFAESLAFRQRINRNAH